MPSDGSNLGEYMLVHEFANLKIPLALDTCGRLVHAEPRSAYVRFPSAAKARECADRDRGGDVVVWSVASWEDVLTWRAQRTEQLARAREQKKRAKS